jgi:hypothetical protein
MTSLVRPNQISTNPEVDASALAAINLSFDQIEKLLPKAMGVANLTWPGAQYFSNTLQIAHGQPRQVLGLIAVPLSGVNASEYTITGFPGATAQQWQIQGNEVTHTPQAATTTTVFWIAFGSR